jgi:hypothetical protein
MTADVVLSWIGRPVPFRRTELDAALERMRMG